MKYNKIIPILNITNTLKNKAFYLGNFAHNNPTKAKIDVVKNDINKVSNELNTLAYYVEKGLFIDERV